MSTIERAAETLSPIEQSSTEQSNSTTSGHDALDPIERAVRERIERSAVPVPERSEPTVPPKFEARNTHLQARPRAEHYVGGTSAALTTNRKPAVEKTGRRSATIEVNLDHLRQQCIIPPDGTRTPTGECIRLIKSQLLINMAESKPGSPANVIMVTSSVPGEGKTFCAINLAISIAQDRERSVLLVDADVASPSIPARFGLQVEQGLMDVLDRNIDMSKVLCKINIGRLSFLPAGTPHRHSTELLASETMRALVQEVAERYDDRIIIFDSPPLLSVSESSVLANHMGQIAVVVEAGKTPEQVLLDALDRIDSKKIAGLVLNKGRGSREGYGAKYGYGEDA